MACELKKPIILHEKSAHEDVMEILKKYEETLPSLVFHSFVGTLDEAKSYLQFSSSYIAVSGKCLDFYILIFEIQTFLKRFLFT